MELIFTRWILGFVRNFVGLEPSPVAKPSIVNIIRMYSSMTHGVTMKALCCRLLPRDSNIDEM